MEFGLAEGIGCILALVLLLVCFVFEVVRWTPFERDDRIGGLLWLWTVVTGGLAVVSLPLASLRPLDVLGLGAVGVLLLLWGLHHWRDWQSWSAFGVISRLGVVLSGGVLVAWGLNFDTGGPDGWSLMPLWSEVSWLARLDTDAMTPRQQLHFYALVVFIFSLIHVPMRPGGPRKGILTAPAWGLLRGLHTLFAVVAWGLIGLIGAIALDHTLDESWADGPKGIAGLMLSQMGTALSLFLLMTLFVGVGILLSVGPWTAEALERVSIETMRRPHRRRLTLTHRGGLLESWRQLTPTTGAPLLLALAATSLVFESTVWLVATAGFGLLTLFLAGPRAYKRKVPFEPLVVDLERQDNTQTLESLAWHPEHGLLLKRGLFVPMELSDPEGLLDGPVVLAGGRYVAMAAHKIKQLGVMPQKPEDKVPGETSQLFGEEDESQKEKMKWRLVVMLEGGELSTDLATDLPPAKLLGILADVWFLGHKLGCPVRLPHRRFDKIEISGELPARVEGDLEAFQAQGKERELLDKEVRWIRRETPEGDWWLAPSETVFAGGFWWLVLVWLAGVGVTVWSLVQSEPLTNGWVIQLMVSGLFLMGLMFETLALWLKHRDPNVYCVAFRPDGLHIQGEVYPWEEIVDLNALPLNDFPMALVHEGRFIGLPCPLPQPQRLEIAAAIGEALRARKAPLRTTGLSPR